MRITGLLLCLVCVYTAGVSARQPAVPLETWAGRQQLPATRYELRWEKFPAGEPTPHDDRAFTGTGLVILDAAGGRTRVDQDERLRFKNRPGQLNRVRQSVRYDGQEQTCFFKMEPAANAAEEPAGVKVAVGVWGGSMHWPDEFAPLAWAHGLVVPSGGPQIGPFPTAWWPTSERFRPAGTDVIDGRPCAVLRDATAAEGVTATLHVDAADGAVLRTSRVRAGGSTQVVAVTYRDTPHGRLPAGWEVTNTRPGQPPAVEAKVTVSAARFDPPAADDFRVALRPGMYVERQGQTWSVGPEGVQVPLESSEGERPTLMARALAVVGPIGFLGLVMAACLVVGLLALRRRVRATS
ncbi:hypothetical protein [Urbifossiella limnaea]|uniref:Uncharacterized protein n=1 Tax=Urbifossiella limnaea TaxID=2528023 RepID=A0A517XY15_9BACT|nr:hypothetical protein [Urbifossiella limnaea]QDU22385.1 hypothetical protein ETAA1_43650 [Urbifossiella limnaea]